MVRKWICLIVMLFISVQWVIGQQTPPGPTLAQLQEQIDSLKKQQELEKVKNDLANRRLLEILDNLPKSSIKPLENQTTFNKEKDLSAETISLSYDALRELAKQIGNVIQPTVEGYSGIVIYNEPDFNGLARYRMYRSESKIALKNYELLAKAIEELGKDHALADGGMRVKSIDPVTAGLNLPAIGTSYVKSVAELLSLFRSETNISTSLDTIDPTSIGTAMAHELRNSNGRLKIFYPQAFVPEYDLDTERADSLFTLTSKINAARANVGDFIAACQKLPQAQREKSPLKEAVALADVVRQQLKAVSIDEAPPTGGVSNRSSSDNDGPRFGMAEFRQLIRAEKLDHFLRDEKIVKTAASPDPKIGILKLRLLASGGSRRETRNLFLGNKIHYSGGAVVEMLLFDVDGTLRLSEIFSLHTGFRKMKTP
jgi:hypothetical protein